MLFSLGKFQTMSPWPGFATALGLFLAGEGRHLPRHSWNLVLGGPCMWGITWCILCQGSKAGGRELACNVTVRYHGAELLQYKIHLVTLRREWNGNVFIFYNIYKLLVERNLFFFWWTFSSSKTSELLKNILIDILSPFLSAFHILQLPMPPFHNSNFSWWPVQLCLNGWSIGGEASFSFSSSSNPL